MKKLLKSKKTLVAMCLVLVAVIVSGATFAWFTWSVAPESAEVEMGRLILGATFEVDEDADLYEPGLTVEKLGTVSNDGSLALLARIGLNGEVTIRSDADGYPLDEADEYTVPISSVDGITVEIDEDVLGWYDDGDVFYEWYIHPATGDYYILIDGNVDVPANFSVELSGSLGNLYQGAIIDYAGEWLATQVMDDAIYEVFGITYDELEYADDYLSGASAPLGRSTSSSARDEMHAKIAALLGR